MRQLVEQHVLLERRGARGIRTGEEVQLHARQRAVRSHGEVRVVRPGEVLRFGADGVVSDAAAAEVVRLEIARRFSESELVQQIVIAIRPEEHVRDFAPPVVHARRRVGAERRRVVREVEDTERRADRTAVGVDAIGCGEVQSRVDVVAGRRVHAVGHPAEVVEEGKLADERERGSEDAGRLEAGAGERGRGHERRRARGVVDGVGRGLRLVFADVLAEEDVGDFGADQDPVRIVAEPERHRPHQVDRAGIEREVLQLGADRLHERAAGVRDARAVVAGEVEIGRRDVDSDRRGGDGDGLRRGDDGRVGGVGVVDQDGKLAAGPHELSRRRERRLELAAEDLASFDAALQCQPRQIAGGIRVVRRLHQVRDLVGLEAVEVRVIEQELAKDLLAVLAAARRQLAAPSRDADDLGPTRVRAGDHVGAGDRLAEVLERVGEGLLRVRFLLLVTRLVPLEMTVERLDGGGRVVVTDVVVLRFGVGCRKQKRPGQREEGNAEVTAHARGLLGVHLSANEMPPIDHRGQRGGPGASALRVCDRGQSLYGSGYAMCGRVITR